MFIASGYEIYKYALHRRLKLIIEHRTAGNLSLMRFGCWFISKKKPNNVVTSQFSIVLIVLVDDQNISKIYLL